MARNRFVWMNRLRQIVSRFLERDIGQYALIIVVATIVSRIIGYGREILMAAIFATSSATDAWLMASVLPNLLFGALYGAVSNLVVPLYLEARQGPSRGSSNRFIQEVFTLLTVIAVVLSIVVLIFSSPIIHGLAPGFHGQTFRQTVTMTRIMLPTFLFWLWAGLLTALLQSLNLYGPSAWAPVLLNIVRITAIATLGHLIGIIGVAWGFTIGVGLQLLLLGWGIRRTPIRIRFRWSFRHPLVRKLIRLSLPVVLTSLTGALGLIVDRIFASRLATGNIAALNYSVLLIQLPLGLLVMPLVTPILTALSQRFIQKDFFSWWRLLWKAGRVLVVVMGTATIILIVFRVPLIRLLYERGAFGNHSVHLTAMILPYFAVGLIAMALSQLFLKALVSIQYTASLSFWTLAATAANIVVDFLLVHSLQARGLALGTSIANVVYAGGMAWSLASAIRHQRRRSQDSVRFEA